ncbi:MAG TPA: penicillin acylase family protein [Candidatus Cybelea sp.]|nr:penicillin acylase family protein [Candidatus Cybelea sp.]
MKLLLRAAAALLAVVLLLAIGFALDVGYGMRVHARFEGTISGLALQRPVMVLRDDRGVPHVIAGNERDAVFAQGYLEGSDRLFQMDLLRRFVLGELAEVFGSAALAQDRRERAIPIRAIVDAQWRHLAPQTRELLGAFSDGVNAAMQREPLPVEFRLLFYRPRPWTPQDSLAVSMATVLDLTDDWNDIADRDAAWHRGPATFARRFPFSDPCYDAPVLLGFAGMAPGPSCHRDARRLASELSDTRAPVGSNEWAAGARRSLTGRALLANDPHLGLRMPGVWYLIDMRAPGLHVAGATLPGCPGIVLGHNDVLAWGATSGTVTSLSVYLPPANLDPAGWQTETIGVRFHRDVTARYYRTRDLFGVTTAGGRFVLVRWDAYDHPYSSVEPIFALDEAGTIEAATAALSAFPDPTLNFALADATGRAAYVLAGHIPNDPARGRWFHPASDLRDRYPPYAFSRLPKVAPSRDAVVWSANNKMYGPSYPLALSPQFAVPYRAYRIAQLLRARRTYDVDYFTRMQLDVLSLPELELARDAGIAWNGEMNGASTTATAIERLRLRLTDRHTGRMPSVLADKAVLRDATREVALEPAVPWRIAGADPVLHALATLGINFLDGVTLPGNGDAYTLHMQSPGYSQSFRAVWDVGNWDAGGITIPQGESGEPGSGHYTDQAEAWIAGRLWPLPFSDAAVQSTAVDRLTLLP